MPLRLQLKYFAQGVALAVALCAGAALCGLAVAMLTGCMPTLPDTGDCIRDCDQEVMACFDGVSSCLDYCGDDRKCATGCSDQLTGCIDLMLTCVSECVDTAEEALGD